MPTTVNLATELRQPLIGDLQRTLEKLVLEPNAAPSDRQRAALREVLEAYSSLVEATSTSSSPAYAYRDLPPEERRAHDSAKHLLMLLDRLHGPQAAL